VHLAAPQLADVGKDLDEGRSVYADTVRPNSETLDGVSLRVQLGALTAMIRQPFEPRGQIYVFAQHGLLPDEEFAIGATA
jgi:hypothetical protein